MNIVPHEMFVLLLLLKEEEEEEDNDVRGEEGGGDNGNNGVGGANVGEGSSSVITIDMSGSWQWDNGILGQIQGGCRAAVVIVVNREERDPDCHANQQAGDQN